MKLKKGKSVSSYENIYFNILLKYILFLILLPAYTIPIYNTVMILGQLPFLSTYEKSIYFT